jgi:hypothetical protein
MSGFQSRQARVARLEAAVRPDPEWSAILGTLTDDVLRELETILVAHEASEIDKAETLARCRQLLDSEA